jgi:hypothetical protein
MVFCNYSAKGSPIGADSTEDLWFMGKLFCMLNHTCPSQAAGGGANAMIMFSHDSNSFNVRCIAKRHIKHGEEVTISYATLEHARAAGERHLRAHLKKTRLFDCLCKTCRR